MAGGRGSEKGVLFIIDKIEKAFPFHSIIT
jgi:hypothetical protein